MPTGVYPRTEQHKKNLSKAAMGRKPWNKAVPKNPAKGLAYANTVRICETCGKNFETKNRNIWRGGGKYCGKNCNPYFQSLRKYSSSKENCRAYYQRHIKQRREDSRVRSARARKDPAIRKHLNELCRKWRKRNPERAKSLCREWMQKHPLKVRLYGAKRRAAKRDATISKVTPEGILARFSMFSGCYYCGNNHQPMTIDHRIPLSRGGAHYLSNIVPACKSCNSSKGTKTETEFLALGVE